MTREEALEELSKPLYDPKQLEEDKIYIQKKLGFSEEEFVKLLKTPPRQATDFPSDVFIHGTIKKTQYFIEKLIGKSIVNYT